MVAKNDISGKLYIFHLTFRSSGTFVVMSVSVFTSMISKNRHLISTMHDRTISEARVPANKKTSNASCLHVKNVIALYSLCCPSLEDTILWNWKESQYKSLYHIVPLTEIVIGIDASVQQFEEVDRTTVRSLYIK